MRRSGAPRSVPGTHPAPVRGPRHGDTPGHRYRAEAGGGRGSTRQRRRCPPTPPPPAASTRRAPLAWGEPSPLPVRVRRRPPPPPRPSRPLPPPPGSTSYLRGPGGPTHTHGDGGGDGGAGAASATASARRTIPSRCLLSHRLAGGGGGGALARTRLHSRRTDARPRPACLPPAHSHPPARDGQARAANQRPGPPRGPGLLRPIRAPPGPLSLGGEGAEPGGGGGRAPSSPPAGRACGGGRHLYFA